MVATGDTGACAKGVAVTKLYSDTDPQAKSKLATLQGAGLLGTVTAQQVQAKIIELGGKDMALALELKVIMDDILLRASVDIAAAGAGGLSSPSDTNVNTIKSLANPDAFKITHLSTGNSLWIPGTCTSFTEKYSPTYTKEMVYGRMDPITTYGSTSRTITFNWEVDTNGGADIYALTAINDVIKFMYPRYSKTSLLGAPTLRVKFLNLIGNPLKNTAAENSSANKPATSPGLIVIVDDFSISGVDGTSKGMNTVRKQFVDKTLLIPQSYDLSFVFTVLHETKVVGWTGEKVFGQGKQFPYGYPSTIHKSPSGPSAQATPLDVRKADQPSLLELGAVKKSILS
jgi:hypothetical protein